MKRNILDSTASRESEGPSLPLLHTWKGVYLFVLGTFVLWIALLIVLTKLYS
jgi:hypothetical protein